MPHQSSFSFPLILIFLLTLFTLPALSLNSDQVPTGRPAARDRVGKEWPAWTRMRWINTPDGQVPDLKDRVALVRFWTDGCPFCVRTVPALKQLEVEYKAQGLVIIGVYHPKPRGRRVTAEEVAAAAKEIGINFPVAIDEEWKFIDSVWLDTGHDRAATSASFLIDHRGRVRYVHPGVEFFPSEDAKDRDAASDYRDIHNAVRMLLDERKANQSRDEN